MISNRFSKMLSTRLPPYIISFQWAENKNLIHKSIATSIRCTLVHILFCSIRILHCLYPLGSVLHRCACCREEGGLAQGSGGVKRQRTAGRDPLRGAWATGSVGAQNLHCGQGRQPPQAPQSRPVGEWEWRKAVLPWPNSFPVYPLLGLS